MKRITQYGLSLVASVVLTACSGGGGAKDHTAQPPQVQQIPPKSEQPLAQPTPKTEEKSAKLETEKVVQPETKPAPLMAEKPAKPEIKPVPPAEEKPVEPELKPTPPVEEKPVQPKPVPEFNNQQIFDNFGKTGGEFETLNWITLQFNDNKITMLPISSQIDINNESPELETLLDKDGRLLGYYGYAFLTKTEPNPLYPDEQIATHANFPLLEMDESQKVQPERSIEYVGKLYYRYASSPENLEGRAVAHYANSDKRISLDLFGEKDEHWILKDDRRQGTVVVGKDGTVFGQLYEGKKSNATFSGGIYGKQGEVFVGKAEFDDYTNSQNSWKGVVSTKERAKDE